MAVEIVILSGSRQGQRWVSDEEQFRAGDEPACEIFFDPTWDPPARGRILLFRHSEDGWSVVPMGPPGVMLDHDPVSEPSPIRSGQVVRMSADGPDFSFRIVAASAVHQGGADTSAGVGVSPAYTAKMPVAPAAPVAPGMPELPDAAAPSELGVDIPGLVLEGERSPPAIPVRWLLIGMLAVAAAVFLIGWAIFNERSKRALIAQNPAATQSEVLVSAKPSEALPEPEKPKPPPAAEQEKPRAPTWEAALAPVKKAIYLLEVEQTAPGGATMAWPFASCCAIAGDVLLTTGNVGCELLRFRHKKFKVYATRPDEHVKEEVTGVRIRADFFGHDDDRALRRFYDLALLSVAGRLPSVAPLATQEELAAVEEGVRLGLLGYPHEGTKITTHDDFNAKLTEGRVFLVRASGTSRCLDLTAEVPPNAYGSAVFTREGKLVGIYNEPPQENEARGLANLHFITAVHPEMIRRGLDDRDGPLWVEPRIEVASGGGSKP